MASFSSSPGFSGPRSKTRRCPAAFPRRFLSSDDAEAGGEPAVSKAVPVQARPGSSAALSILVLFERQSIVAFLIKPFWSGVVLLGVMRPLSLQGRRSTSAFWSRRGAECLSSSLLLGSGARRGGTLTAGRRKHQTS